MDRDPYSDYNDYIRKRRDGLSERKVENMIKKEIAKNKPKIGWLKALTIFLLIYSLVMSYFVVKNMTGITETINKNGQVESSTISIKNSSVSTENAVAKKSLDSVVGITTVGVQENMFFQGRVVEGVGSGVVVSKDGYILTNAHVVQDGKAEKIDVLLTNGKKSSAKLLWYDTTLDLAVIKTDLTGLKPVEMGDSDKVQIGDKAIAIGNPLGLDLQSTLTSGYISGKDRTITLQNGLQMDGLMQTDAAINSGNSGGGLFDQEGKLIGINTAKASAEGIGLGVLGIGLPDIVVFTGFILRGIYETALQYGFTYDATEEKLLILKMMEASLSHGEEWVRVNAEVDRILAKEWHGNHAEDDVTQQIRRTADVFALDMLLAKFIQGLPLIGIVGGAGNPVYYGKVIRYAQLKYHKRYLQEKLDKINKELK